MVNVLAYVTISEFREVKRKTRITGLQVPSFLAVIGKLHKLLLFILFDDCYLVTWLPLALRKPGMHRDETSNIK